MPTGPVRPPGTFSPWVLWKGLAPVFLCGLSCYSALAVGQGPSGCSKDVNVSTKPLFSISVSQTPDLMQLRNQPTNRLPHLHHHIFQEPFPDPASPPLSGHSERSSRLCPPLGCTLRAGRGLCTPRPGTRAASANTGFNMNDSARSSSAQASGSLGARDPRLSHPLCVFQKRWRQTGVS
uniref:Uncharacterized protein n=1 Tax=Piliocolobus tephrosceles TaxID=591936 RepID=A0A8C9LV74_9PRIM